MEFLLVPLIGLVALLFKRSIDDRKRLARIEAQHLDQLAYLSKSLVEQQQEVARLRGMSLELLKAQVAVRGRLTQLIDSAAPHQLPAAGSAPPENLAPPAPATSEPGSAPPAVAEPGSSPLVSLSPYVARAVAAAQADADAAALAEAAATAAADAGLGAAPAEAWPSAATESAEPSPAPVAESTLGEHPAAEHGEQTAAASETASTTTATTTTPASPAADFMPPPPPAEVPMAPASEPSAPPPRPTPAFDWETLLGVRGAAWLGAVALVIAGTLFAKYSIENDLVKPPLRIAFLILLALTALGSSEFLLRPRYATTANAICGGGIAILYAALFAAHNLYSLVGLIPTFALMGLTTVTAALLALRYENMYIAVLGMLGGFATPLALSTGQDRPYGLFAYILMLDLGFLLLAVRRGWHRLALLNLVATLLMEAGWAGKFLSPAKMPIGVGVALVFALLFMALPAYLRGLTEKQKREILYGSATAGLLPFGFAWVLAAHPQYARNWPLLFGFAVCLELGLLWVALRRWPVLAMLAFLATAATHALWDLTSLSPPLLPVAVGAALVLAGPLWALPGLWKKLQAAGPDLAKEAAPAPLRLAAVLGASAPLLLGCVLATQDEYGMRWTVLLGGMFVSVAALLWLALRHSPVVAVTTAVLAATEVFLWTASSLQPPLLVPLLGVALGLASLFLGSVGLAGRFSADRGVARPIVHGAALAVLIPLLLCCRLAAQPTYGERWPLVFGALFCANACVLWLGANHLPLLLRLGLGLTIACHALWIGTSMSAAQAPLAMGLALLFALPYLALPARRESGSEPAADGADSTLAAVAPFALAFYLASTPGHAERWGLLFGFVAILDGLLLTIAAWRQRPLLLLVAASATSLTQVAWAVTALRPETLWGGTLCSLGLAAALGAMPRLWTRRTPPAAGAVPLPEWAGLVTLVGLVLFTAQLIPRGLAQPPWAFVLLTALCTALLIERTRCGAIAGTGPIGGLVLAVLVQAFFASGLPRESAVTELLAADVLLRNLAVPLLLCTVLSVAAALRTGRFRAAAATKPSDPATLLWKHAARDSEVGALLATLTPLLGLILMLESRSIGSHPGLLFTALLLLDGLILLTVARQQWSWLTLVALAATAVATTLWQHEHFQPADGVVALLWLGVLYLFFLFLPLLMLRALPPLRTHRSLFVAAALAGPLLFIPLHQSFVGALGRGLIGALPVVQAALSLAALAIVQSLPRPAPTEQLPSPVLARRELGHRALMATVALGFLATAIPLQLDRQWIAVAWALLAAAVWWLYRRLPHPGLKYFGLLLYAAVVVRLVPTAELLHYHHRGLPVLNWLLYSYGVPCLCFLIGAAFLRQVESRYRSELEKTFPIGSERVPLHAVASFSGLLLIFVLINLEIADAFSPGPYTELWLTRSYARDLTRSLAWGVYALVLLIVGMRRDSRALRYFSLGAMLLTIAKVFLYDLANVGGIYRSLSFLGLAVSLILVSLLYQRFVFQTQSRRQAPGGSPPAAGGSAEPPKGTKA